MGNLDKEGLDDVFLNVRKAYRLLFEYQTKVKELVKFIGNYFSYTSPSLIGNSLFSSNSPNNEKKLDLDRWAWDWLNMYAYEFNFGVRNDIKFVIRLYTDTGWYDKNTDRSTRTKIETFETSKKSKTKLLLVSAKNRWKPEEIFDSFSSEETDYCKIDDANTLILGRSYDLSTFMNEEETIKQLEDFTAFCEEKGITIKEES